MSLYECAHFCSHEVEGGKIPCIGSIYDEWKLGSRQENDFWTGLIRDDSGNFTWVDETCDSGYENWVRDTPKSVDCVRLYTAYLGSRAWFNGACSVDYECVCQPTSEPAAIDFEWLLGKVHPECTPGACSGCLSEVTCGAHDGKCQWHEASAGCYAVYDTVCEAGRQPSNEAVPAGPGPMPETTSIRLRVGAGVPSLDAAGRVEGRLEVFHDGQWGTVYDDGLEESGGAENQQRAQTASEVACRQLGNDLGYTATSWERVGSKNDGGPTPIGSGKNWLCDLVCDGSEASLADCGHSGWAHWGNGYVRERHHQQRPHLRPGLTHFALASFSGTTTTTLGWRARSP
jgi:hypothetical protein